MNINQLIAESAIFRWDGDLADDCTCKWMGMFAHAEAMSDRLWWCAVYPRQGKRQKGEEDIFNSGENGPHPTSGKIARSMCEAAMRAVYRDRLSRQAAKKRGAKRG